jgi:hydrogenase expression/formation protein HypE
MTGETIRLDHGSGGGLSQELVAELIAPRLGPAHTGRMEDSAVLELEFGRIALSTDSFVIDPIFFGNGDIGRLAVCGTVNDLAASGAVPRYLTLSLLIEQGLAIADLARVLDSVRDAAIETGLEVVAGDTQVLRRGEVDKLYVNTTGVGELARGIELSMSRVRPGDSVIVTSWLGDHSVHILSLREGLGYERSVLSDCAPLDGLVWNILEEHAADVHCMRDVTRGGLGTVLNELARGAGVSIEIEEDCLPIRRDTGRAAQELGVDPLYLANEGCICMFVEGSAASEVLELIRWQPQGEAAQIVGTVRERDERAVMIVRRDGTEAVVEMLRDGALARLC